MAMMKNGTTTPQAKRNVDLSVRQRTRNLLHGGAFHDVHEVYTLTPHRNLQHKRGVG